MLQSPEGLQHFNEAEYITTIGLQGTVKGRFFNDTLSLDKYKLDSFKMVVSSEAPSTTLGSLGLGFGAEDNATVLDAMVAADLIKSRKYSLWLNSHKSDTGARKPAASSSASQRRPRVKRLLLPRGLPRQPQASHLPTMSRNLSA